MIRLFLVAVSLIMASVVNAQIKLPGDFICLNTGDGYTMANTAISFLYEDLSNVLIDEDLEKEYLTGFTKSKDGLFIRSQKSKEFITEIYIPETKRMVSVSSKKDKAQVDQYSKKLVAEILKNRKQTAIYFSKQDGSICRD